MNYNKISNIHTGPYATNLMSNRNPVEILLKIKRYKASLKKL